MIRTLRILDYRVAAIIVVVPSAFTRSTALSVPASPCEQPAPAKIAYSDLSAFLKTHPVKNPNPPDFEPDGTWYSMIAVRGAFFAVEPNHGELDMITTNGQIRRIADTSATQGHIVPTAIAYHGNFYVGNLNTFPIQRFIAMLLCTGEK